DWNVIGEVAAAVNVPVIGNGDITSPADVARRRQETSISAVMIGRAAMSAPWIFAQTKQYLATGDVPAAPSLTERWNIILRHCRLAGEEWDVEEPRIRSMRARLMAYSKGFPGSKQLREKFQHVSSVVELERIRGEHIAQIRFTEEAERVALSPSPVGEAVSFPGKATPSPTVY